MSVISKDKNAIKIFYNSKSKVGRQTLSYIEGSYKEILAIDTEKTKVTGTQYADMCENLNCLIGDLIDKEHPAFNNHYARATNLNEDDWIKVLHNHPEVLVYPVVIIGKNYYQIKNPSDIVKYLEPNSSGLDEQNP